MNAPCPVTDAKPLVGELTIQFAAEHRTSLMAMLEEAQEDLHLDLSGIEACDSSGVQLLLATRRSLAERGRALNLHSPSLAVKQVLATYGLHVLLRGPAVEAQAEETAE